MKHGVNLVLKPTLKVSRPGFSTTKYQMYVGLKECKMYEYLVSDCMCSVSTCGLCWEYLLS